MVGRDPATPGNGVGNGIHVELGTKIDDRDVFSGLRVPPAVFRGDPSEPEAPQEYPASQVLERDVGDDRGDEKHNRGVPKTRDAADQILDGLAEDESNA